MLSVALGAIIMNKLGVGWDMGAWEGWGACRCVGGVGWDVRGAWAPTCPTIGLAQAAQCPFGTVLTPCRLMSLCRLPSIASRLLLRGCAAPPPLVAPVRPFVSPPVPTAVSPPAAALLSFSGCAYGGSPTCCGGPADTCSTHAVTGQAAHASIKLHHVWRRNVSVLRTWQAFGRARVQRYDNASSENDNILVSVTAPETRWVTPSGRRAPSWRTTPPPAVGPAGPPGQGRAGRGSTRGRPLRAETVVLPGTTGESESPRS